MPVAEVVQEIAEVLTTQRIPTGSEIAHHNALGQILSHLGYSDLILANMSTDEAILIVKQRLDIPTIQVSLIDIADRQRAGAEDTRPLRDALLDPQELLGEFAEQVFLLGRMLDYYTSSEWQFLRLDIGELGSLADVGGRLDQKYAKHDDNFPRWLQNGRNASELAVRANFHKLRTSLPRFFEPERLVQFIGIAVNEVQVQRHLPDRQSLPFVDRIKKQQRPY